jgi:hypothetical protein
MFTVRFTAGICFDSDEAVVHAATAGEAIAFAAAFAPNGHGVLVSEWFERDGEHIAEIYDWCDCWFPEAHPVAEITAPPEILSRAIRRKGDLYTVL